MEKLSQSTRQRLQALVQNPNFLGSVYIADRKFESLGKQFYVVNVEIHSDGLNTWALLAELFPDMNLNPIEHYETEHDHAQTISFGDYTKGKIEDAEVRVWASYGERPIKKAPIEGAENNFTSDYTAEEVMAQ
ncbi:MAG: hypothetical protein Q8912_15300 [Bacillota bacterium]|nr:hypothetical protein [Bacillota bacterium]